jgi:hypothetical protein
MEEGRLPCKTVTQRHAAASLTDVQATCCYIFALSTCNSPKVHIAFPLQMLALGEGLILLYLRTAQGKATSSEVMSQLQYPMCEARRRLLYSRSEHLGARKHETLRENEARVL